MVNSIFTHLMVTTFCILPTFGNADLDETKPWHRCLVLNSMSREGNNASITNTMNCDYIQTICSDKPSNDDLHDLVRVWLSADPIDTLELKCNTETSDCVCSSYVPDDYGEGMARCPTRHENCRLQSFNDLSMWAIDRLQDVTTLKLISVGLRNLTGLPLLRNLTFLWIEGNNLHETNISKGEFCHFHILRSLLLLNTISGVIRKDMLDCSDTGNTSIPLETLAISGGRLHTLPADFVKCASNLHTLSLSYLSLEDMHRDSLAGLSSLNRLLLNDNNITDIQPGTFTSLTSLMSLDVANNNLHHFDTSWIGTCLSIRYLRLLNNNINNINGSFLEFKKLQLINLQNNSLHQVKIPWFSSTSSLNHLDLSQNKIKIIEDGSFEEMTNLIAFNLSYNQLHNPNHLRNIIRGMQKLQLLYLHNNNLTYLPQNMFSQEHSVMTQLTYVSLEYNRIEGIHPKAFDFLPMLSMLNIKHNRLQTFQKNTFSTLQSLLALLCDNNLLTTLPDALFSPSIQWLSLDHNKFRRFPKFNQSEVSMLVTLSLYNNTIEELYPEELEPLTNMAVLDLGKNNILQIPGDIFQHTKQLNQLSMRSNRLTIDFNTPYFADLDQLEFVDLSENNITSIKHMFIHNYTRNIKTLYLSSNPISSVSNLFLNSSEDVSKMEVLHLDGCLINKVDHHAFAKMHSITLIDLSFNLLTELRPLIISSNYPNYAIRLQGNPIKCNCNMVWTSNVQYQENYMIDGCQHVIDMTYMPLKNISLNDFICSDMSQCPFNETDCHCYSSEVGGPIIRLDCVAMGYNIFPQNISSTTRVLHLEGNMFGKIQANSISENTAIQQLFLHNCSITYVAPGELGKFKRLRILQLSWNYLHVLDDKTFINLNFLTNLYLDNNNLHIISGSVLLPLQSLAMLTLHNNQLTKITLNTRLLVSSVVPLKQLSLSGNNWLCDCDNYSFVHWLEQNRHIVTDIEHLECIKDNDSIVSQTRIMCDESTTSVIRWLYRRRIILLSLLIGIVIFVVISVVSLYKRRSIIGLFIFNKYGRQSRQKQSACKYDAFCVYNGASSNALGWVGNEFIRRLEPRYRLCLQKADDSTTTLTSKMIKMMKDSKRTVLVFSGSDLTNCSLLRLTFQRAFQHLTQEDNDHRIIIVMHEYIDIQDSMLQNQLHDNLKDYLIRKKYICTTDKRFWRKLLYKMPHVASTDISGVNV